MKLAFQFVPLLVILFILPLCFSSCIFEDDEHCDYEKTLKEGRIPSDWNVTPIFQAKPYQEDSGLDAFYLTYTSFGLLLKAEDVCSNEGVSVSVDVFIHNSQIYKIENGLYKFYLKVSYGPANGVPIYSKSIRLARKNTDEPVLRLEEYPLILFGAIDDLEASKTKVVLSMSAVPVDPFTPGNIRTIQETQNEAISILNMVSAINAELQYTKY